MARNEKRILPKFDAKDLKEFLTSMKESRKRAFH